MYNFPLIISLSYSLLVSRGTSCLNLFYPLHTVTQLKCQSIDNKQISQDTCIMCVLVYKCLHQAAPVYLSELCIPLASSTCRSHLRSAVKECLVISYCRTKNYGQRSFSYSGPTLWNSLPLTLRDKSMSLSQFCSRLKTEMFCRAYKRS